MADDSFTKVIQEIGISFDFNEDNINHAMDILGKELKKIIDNRESLSIDEKQRISFQLKSFEIALFRRWALSLSETTRKNLFCFLRYQIRLDMDISSDVAQSYFDLSLDYLTSDSILEYLSGRRSTTSIDDEFLFFICSIGSGAVYTMTDRSPSMSVSFRNIPKFFPFNDKTERLLRGLLTYLNQAIRNGSLSDGQESIAKWINNMLDITSFVPYFVRTGYPTTILQWFSIEPKDTTLDMKSWYYVIALLYNLVRHESAVQVINQNQGISILKTWKDRYLTNVSFPMNDNDIGILIDYYMIYALLLDPVVLKQEDLTSIQLTLDQILNQTVQAFEKSKFILDSCDTRVSEYLTVLTRFTANDKCLLYILKYRNMFELFVEKFLLYNQLFLTNVDVKSIEWNRVLCSLLYNIFWSISFQSEYLDALKSNIELVQFVQQMAKIQGDEEYIVLMRKSANGILFNLDLVQQSLLPKLLPNRTDIDGVKVMISYSHKDSSFCRRLVNILQNHVKGDIWVDFVKLEPPYEDDWEEIAEAITNCDVVVMIVTEYYCSSKSCRREVIHADKRHKQMIPVYQGTQYEPEDWFEIRACSATWVRFGAQRSDDEAIETLIRLINAQKKAKKQPTKISMHQKPDVEQNIIAPPVILTSSIVEAQPLVPQPPPNILPPTVMPRKPTEQWTDEEVQQWLQLSPSILHLSSGHALLTYANLVTHEDVQHDEYERNLRSRGLSREQFANLISSLIHLRSSHNVKSTSTTPPEQWARDEVKCWFEQNGLSAYLMEALGFGDGIELVTYTQTLISSQMRIDDEYDRLRAQIKTLYNGQDLLQLSEYTRLVSASKKLVEKRKQMPQPSDDTGSGYIS